MPQPPSNQDNNGAEIETDIEDLTHQTARLHFRPVNLNDTLALHELRTEPEVMKWSRQRVPDASLQETANWIRKMTDQPPLEAETADAQAQAGIEAKAEAEPRDTTASGEPRMPTNHKKNGHGNVKKDRTKTGISFAVRELSHVQTMADAKKEGGAEVPDRIVAIAGVRAIESPFSGKLQFEIGYMFVPRTWGKGYASETVRGLVRWWFAFLKDHGQAGVEGGESEKEDEGESGAQDKDRVYAIVSKKNAASLRVMEKCGFRVCAEGVDGDDGTGIVEFCISSAEI